MRITERNKLKTILKILKINWKKIFNLLFRSVILMKICD